MADEAMTTRYTIADLADDLDGNAREHVHLLRAHQRLQEAVKDWCRTPQQDEEELMLLALSMVEAAEEGK